MAKFKDCVDGYNTTKQECIDRRDDGYSDCKEFGQSCTTWAKECVISWIPIIGPAICKVFEWICKAAEWVCTAAVWVVNLVCHAWKAVNTFVCTVWQVVGWVLAIPAIVIKVIFSLPFIGAIIKEGINFFTASVIGITGGLLEGIACGLFGVCPAKYMRLCIIISRYDEQPVAMPAELQPIIDRTVQIFRDQANVHLWVTVNEGSAGPKLRDIKCDSDAWLQDLNATGMAYELSEGRYCRNEAFASIIGFASPIYAFVVKDVIGKKGCSLWWLTNYIVFEPDSSAHCAGNTHLAHEMGHCCGLFKHAKGTSNLMFPNCTNPGRDQLSGFQKSVIRGSKYANYF